MTRPRQANVVLDSAATPDAVQPPVFLFGVADADRLGGLGYRCRRYGGVVY